MAAIKRFLDRYLIADGSERGVTIRMYVWGVMPPMLIGLLAMEVSPWLWTLILPQLALAGYLYKYVWERGYGMTTGLPTFAKREVGE